MKKSKMTALIQALVILVGMLMPDLAEAQCNFSSDGVGAFEEDSYTSDWTAHGTAGDITYVNSNVRQIELLNHAEIEAVELYTVRGLKLLNQQQPDECISLKACSTGIYVLHVRYKNNSYKTQRILLL